MTALLTGRGYSLGRCRSDGVVHVLMCVAMRSGTKKCGNLHSIRSVGYRFVSAASYRVASQDSNVVWVVRAFGNGGTER